MKKTEFKTVNGERIVVECPPEIDWEDISCRGDYSHLTTGQLMYMINLEEGPVETPNGPYIDEGVSYAILPDGETVVVINNFDYKPKGEIYCKWHVLLYSDETTECENHFLDVIAGTGDDGKTYYRWTGRDDEGSIIVVSRWFKKLGSATRNMRANRYCSPFAITDHTLVVD